MNKKFLPTIGIPALLAGALAACGPVVPTPTVPIRATPPAAGPILINGAGATFPFPL
ncbi:MAG: hypothetical protein HY783_06035, partial [Chloroflexi bacterium]|nr:hypothetical protein [Chloroflexota bacterium]